MLCAGVATARHCSQRCARTSSRDYCFSSPCGASAPRRRSQPPPSERGALACCGRHAARDALAGTEQAGGSGGLECVEQTAGLAVGESDQVDGHQRVAKRRWQRAIAAKSSCCSNAASGSALAERSLSLASMDNSTLWVSGRPSGRRVEGCCAAPPAGTPACWRAAAARAGQHPDQRLLDQVFGVVRRAAERLRGPVKTVELLGQRRGAREPPRTDDAGHRSRTRVDRGHVGHRDHRVCWTRGRVPTAGPNGRMHLHRFVLPRSPEDSRPVSERGSGRLGPYVRGRPARSRMRPTFSSEKKSAGDMTAPPTRAN